MKQIDFINWIVELKAANPDAEIKMCVSNERDCDYIWTAHHITRVELSPYIALDECIYTDKDSAIEEIYDTVDDGKMSDKELEMAADAYYKENVIIAICVYTEA